MVIYPINEEIKMNLKQLFPNATQSFLDKNKHLLTDSDKPVKKSKLRAIRTEIDGINFASKREADRYVSLKLQQERGAITELRLQVGFELNENGSGREKYYADFTYKVDGKLYVEDAKGMKTNVYKRKKKLMKQIYDIDIKEV